MGFSAGSPYGADVLYAVYVGATRKGRPFPGRPEGHFPHKKHHRRWSRPVPFQGNEGVGGAICLTFFLVAFYVTINR